MKGLISKMENSALLEKPFEYVAKDEDTIKVSVVIPAYNVENYIEASMTSIRNQTLEEIEIICINDGSQDKTLLMLQEMELQDKRIRVINQKNQGQSAARNVGLSVASGEYVYFFDSDDLLEKNALEILYNHANCTKSEIILFDGLTFYDNDDLSQRYDKFRYYYQRKNDYEDVYKGEELFVLMYEKGDYLVSPCLQLLSRQYLIAKGLLFREGIIHEDNIFSIQSLVLSSRASHLRLNLFHRRIREQSTMTTQTSVKNYVGYSICYIEMTRFLVKYQKELNKSTVVAAKKLVSSIADTICRIYISITADQRHQIDDSALDFLNIETHIFVLKFERQYKELEAFKQKSSELKQKNNELQKELEKSKQKSNELKQKNNELKQKNNELQKELEKSTQKSISLQKQIDDLKGSLSFKCGRAFTFAPRKLRGCLRHIRTNGIKSTIKYFIELIMK